MASGFNIADYSTVQHTKKVWDQTSRTEIIASGGPTWNGGKNMSLVNSSVCQAKHFTFSKGNLFSPMDARVSWWYPSRTKLLVRTAFGPPGLARTWKKDWQFESRGALHSRSSCKHIQITQRKHLDRNKIAVELSRSCSNQSSIKCQFALSWRQVSNTF